MCKKSFTTYSNCADHLEVYLGNTTCDVCNRVLADKRALARRGKSPRLHLVEIENYCQMNQKQEMHTNT